MAFYSNIKCRRKPRRGPARDKKYLAWIRTLPCAVRTCSWHTKQVWVYPIEAAHSGAHGISQKASDYSAIPLCSWHHRLSPDSYHASAKTFFTRHGLDRKALVKELNERYERIAA
jgi:hypothetical protein